MPAHQDEGHQSRLQEWDDWDGRNRDWGGSQNPGVQNIDIPEEQVCRQLERGDWDGEGLLSGEPGLPFPPQNVMTDA